MEPGISIGTISNGNHTNSCDEDNQHVRDVQVCGDICDRFRPLLVKSESLDTAGQNLGPVTRYRLLDSRKSPPPLQRPPNLRRADTLDACPNSLRNMHFPKQAYDEAYPWHKPWPSMSRTSSPVSGRNRLSDYRQLHRSYPDHSKCNHPVVETKNVATSTSPPPHDITDHAFEMDLPFWAAYKPSMGYSSNPTASPPLNHSPHHHHFSKSSQRNPHQGSSMANKTTSPIPFHQMCYSASRSSPRNLMQTSPLMRQKPTCTSKSPSPQPLMRVVTQDNSNKAQLLQSPLQKMKNLTSDKNFVCSLPQQYHQQQQHPAQTTRHHSHVSGASPIPPLSPPVNPYRNQDYKTSIIRSQTVTSPRSPPKCSSPRWSFMSELPQKDLMPTSLVRAQTISSGSSSGSFYRSPPLPSPLQGLENSRQSPYVRNTRSAQSTPLSASRLLHGGPLVTAAAITAAATSNATIDSTPTSLNYHPNNHIYNYSANLLSSSSNGSSPAHPNIHLRQPMPQNSPHRLADNQTWRSKHMSYPSAEYTIPRKRELRTGSLVDQTDNSDTSEDLNSSSSDASICRICHEGESTAELISPCYCTGSMGKLHVTCLERWLGSSYMNRCEICGYEYLVLRKPKPFIEFLKNPGTQNEKRHLMCDILCFFMLTPLAGVSIWLCLVGAEFFLQWEARWEVPGLACLAVFLLIIYIVWCTVAFRCQYRIWTEWKCRNQTVQIKSVSEDKRRSLPAIISSRRNNSNPSSDVPASLGPSLPMWCTLSSQTILPHAYTRRRISSSTAAAAATSAAAAADTASITTTTTTTAAADILPVPPPAPPPEPTPPPHTPCPVTTTSITDTPTNSNSNTVTSFSFSPSPKNRRVPPQQLAINSTTSAPTHRREFGRVKIDLTQGSVGSCPGTGRRRRDSPHESVLSSSGTLSSNNYEVHLWQTKCESSLDKPIRYGSLVNNVAM